MKPQKQRSFETAQRMKQKKRRSDKTAQLLKPVLNRYRFSNLRKRLLEVSFDVVDMFGAG